MFRANTASVRTRFLPAAETLSHRSICWRSNCSAGSAGDILLRPQCVRRTCLLGGRRPMSCRHSETRRLRSRQAPFDQWQGASTWHGAMLASAGFAPDDRSRALQRRRSAVMDSRTLDQRRRPYANRKCSRRPRAPNYMARIRVMPTNQRHLDRSLLVRLATRPLDRPFSTKRSREWVLGNAVPQQRSGWCVLMRQSTHSLSRGLPARCPRPPGANSAEQGTRIDRQNQSLSRFRQSPSNRLIDNQH